MSEGEASGPWRPAEEWCRPVGDEIDVWLVPLDRELPGDLALSDDERARAERLIVPDKRRQFELARDALRRVLAGNLGREPADLRFSYGEYGRPRLVGEEIAFNLSHSGRLGLIAVAVHGPLGIDVEEIDGQRPLDRLAERFFSKPEHERYRRHMPIDRQAAFFRAWTLKEAYVKALGTGLSFSSRRFTVDFDASSGPLLLDTEWGDGARDWWFELLPVPHEAAGAVCWPGGARPVRCFRFA